MTFLMLRRRPEAILPALLLTLAFLTTACADAAHTGGPHGLAAADTTELPATNFFEIRTPEGRMVVRLFDETPLHRDNFKRLAAAGFYDSTRFHRVIADFMIQGGDPNSRDANPFDDGTGGPGYTIPAEFNPALFHRRGALAAAREGDFVNPERASSGSQFYLVQGTVFPDSVLNEIETRQRAEIPDEDFAFTEEQRRLYTTEGGYPPLDGLYTVFGEIVEGLDVLDRIARTPTPRAVRQRTRREVFDRPFEDLWMIVRPLPDYEAATPREEPAKDS